MQLPDEAGLLEVAQSVHLRMRSIQRFADYSPAVPAEIVAEPSSWRWTASVGVSSDDLVSMPVCFSVEETNDYYLAWLSKVLAAIVNCSPSGSKPNSC